MNSYVCYASSQSLEITNAYSMDPRLGSLRFVARLTFVGFLAVIGRTGCSAQAAIPFYAASL